MSTWLDAYAHDMFPDTRTFQAFAFIGRPVLQLLEQKKHEGVGRNWAYPILQQAAVAHGTTRAAVQKGAAFADADFSGEEFVAGYFNPGYKGGFDISDFDMATTEGSGGVPGGAYAEKFALQMRECASEFGQVQELYFIGKSGRALALSTANGGTTDLSAGTYVLADRTQITNFRLGQLLQFATNDGSGSGDLLGAESDFRVTAMDFDTGTVTIVATDGDSLATLDTAASTNAVYAFNTTDFQGTGASATNALPPGFQDWITVASPTGTFLGVNRANDSRLGGWRVVAGDIAGRQLDAVVDKGLEDAYSLYGCTGEYTVMLSPTRWSQLMDLGEARGYRMLDGKTALGGYRYIERVHGMLTAKIIAVPAMTNDNMLFAKMDTWSIRHLNGWPRTLNGDGLKILRKSTTDDFEYRTASYYHFGCNNVIKNGRADISGIAT